MGENLLEELTLEQKQKLLTLPAELKHFTQTQWAAIYGIVPMTQELFDSIQLERLKAGEELESAALDTFLKYPEFALNYSSRLESDLITSNTISSDDTEENFKKLYEKKSSLQLSLNAYKDVLSDCKSHVHELDVVRQNVDSILNHQTPEYFKTSEQTL